MYLWKVDSLVEDLRSGKVSQREEFKYLMVFTILMVVFTDPVMTSGGSYNFYDSICSILTLVLSVLGIYYCYKVNSSGDDKDLIVRVTCIGLPALIRVMVMTIPVAIAGVLVEEVLGGAESANDISLEGSPMQVVFVALFMAVYYWYLSRKIKAVSMISAL